MPANCRRFRRLAKPLASVTVITVGLFAWLGPARAYRPFDGTDAAVAAKGEMEIELQPAGRLRDESGTSLIAPPTVINYGLSEDWEAVFAQLRLCSKLTRLFCSACAGFCVARRCRYC